MPDCTCEMREAVESTNRCRYWNWRTIWGNWGKCKVQDCSKFKFKCKVQLPSWRWLVGGWNTHTTWGKGVSGGTDVTSTSFLDLCKGPSSQGYGFSSSHVWMWELDCEEGWVPKNWCFCTVVLEKTVENPLDCKEIQPVHSEGDQPWDFFGRNDVEAETPILWPPNVRNWLIGKDPDAGRD